MKGREKLQHIFATLLAAEKSISSRKLLSKKNVGTESKRLIKENRFA